MRISDWSSDVCSSDLGVARVLDGQVGVLELGNFLLQHVFDLAAAQQAELVGSEQVLGHHAENGGKAVGGTRVLDGLAIGAFVDRVGALAKGLVQPRIEATRAVVEERDTLGGAVIRRRAGRKRRGERKSTRL